MSEASPFIFISYSRQDSKYVEALAEAFERRGIPVWIDNHIDYGAAWLRVIETKLENCKALVVVMSPRSRASDWVDSEFQYALELKKKIFPLLLEGREWFGLNRLQVADVTNGLLPPSRFFDNVSVHLSGENKPVVIDPSATVEPKNQKWTGDWFVNVGEGVHRTWEDCVKYGFLQAGQGSIYIAGLKNLEVGRTVYAYVSGHGYVGVGKVTKKAVPIKKFTVGPENTPLLDMPLKAEKPDENKDNLSLSEWVVGVKWISTVQKGQAYRFVGAFANPQVVCKLKHVRTLEFLREKLGSTRDAVADVTEETEHRSWAGDWFVNVGEGSGHRSWEDCRRYGFISAGQGPQFAAAMRKLEVGSIVYAYVSGSGYVGFGKVLEKAVPIKAFTIGTESTPLLEMDLKADGLDINSDDPEFSEWVARIEWLEAVPKEQAYWFTGAFAHVGTLCKLRNQKTLDALHKKFIAKGGIDDNKAIMNS
jgi:hypothetical protein